MSKSKVINACGDYPENFIDEDIASDPNYVFINDPSYNPVNVYDADGNIATVNSFQECEHYVMGGWDREPLELQETSMQYILVLIVLGVLVSKYLVTKLT
jgi:hypothetical protein